jgi:hypothetical protein
MKYEDSKPNKNKIDNGLSVEKTFITWQPSTWPESGENFLLLIPYIELIFKETILYEIGNVISDAKGINGNINHRGHVIALALFCAVDTISSYSYNKIEGNICDKCKKPEKIGPRYMKYIEEFFPECYKPYSSELYGFYRNASVHSWNFFKVGIYPNSEPIKRENNSISFGLLNFYDALGLSVNNFIDKLKLDIKLQKSCRSRYEELRSSAVS